MPNVQVLLKDNVEKLGTIGDIVSVKPGYARNYLLPQGLATLPTIGEIRIVEKKKIEILKKYQEEKSAAEVVSKKISEIGSIEIKAKAGESGKLFGAITSKEIAEILNGKLSDDIKVERKQISLKRAIHELGSHQVKLKLHPEVITEIEIIVSPEAE